YSALLHPPQDSLCSVGPSRHKAPSIDDPALPGSQGIPYPVDTKATSIIALITSRQGSIEIVPFICGAIRANMLHLFRDVLCRLLECHRLGAIAGMPGTEKNRERFKLGIARRFDILAPFTGIRFACPDDGLPDKGRPSLEAPQGRQAL